MRLTTSGYTYSGWSVVSHAVRRGTLLRRMGLADDDCISHELISHAIRGAQEKIGSQVKQEMQTQSAEDWFRYNLREKLWQSLVPRESAR